MHRASAEPTRLILVANILVSAVSIRPRVALGARPHRRSGALARREAASIATGGGDLLVLQSSGIDVARGHEKAGITARSGVGPDLNVIATELCVAGDLNQDLSDRHYYGSRMARQALRAALFSVGLVALTRDLAGPVRAMAPDRASIDHVCVQRDSAHVAPPRPEVWPRGQSDHYGIAVSPA